MAKMLSAQSNLTFNVFSLFFALSFVCWCSAIHHRFGQNASLSQKCGANRHLNTLKTNRNAKLRIIALVTISFLYMRALCVRVIVVFFLDDFMTVLNGQKPLQEWNIHANRAIYFFCAYLRLASFFFAIFSAI